MRLQMGVIFGIALALSACGREETTTTTTTTTTETTATEATQPAEQQMPQTGAAPSLEENQKFLADSKAKPGTIVRPSGLQYRVLEAGTGASPRLGGDMVTVTYKGALINGTVFDQTPEGQTASFPAGQLIPGWVEALSLMKEGDSWELVIPSDLGYGASGAGGVIPPDQTLVFQMKLIKVDPAQ